MNGVRHIRIIIIIILNNSGTVYTKTENLAKSARECVLYVYVLLS